MSSAFLFPGQGSETPGMGGASLRSDGPVRDLLERASKALDVELAATVARGSPALAASAAKFPTVPLPVAGPWHSKAMADAGAKWRACLERVHWRAPKVPLVANATGIFVGPGDNPIELLAGQLTHPVRWATTMNT